MHVSPIGAPHLVDPSRLEKSARRLYGDTFDSLWGELAPVPQENVHTVGGPRARPRLLPRRRATPLTTSATSTPTGRSTPATRAACASCPAAPSCRRRRRPRSTSRRGRTTLDEIERRDPERLALIHFGVAEDVGRHLTELRLNLLDWAESVEGGATEEEFVEYAHAELTDSGEDAPTYDFAMPLWQSYRGLARWAEKRVARLSTES